MTDDSQLNFMISGARQNTDFYKDLTMQNLKILTEVKQLAEKHKRWERINPTTKKVSSKRKDEVIVVDNRGKKEDPAQKEEEMRILRVALRKPSNPNMTHMRN